MCFSFEKRKFNYYYYKSKSMPITKLETNYVMNIYIASTSFVYSTNLANNDYFLFVEYAQKYPIGKRFEFNSEVYFSDLNKSYY